MLIKCLPVSLFILTLCCLNPCKAQSTFTGSINNFFSIDDNWNPSGVPVSGSEIIISAGVNLVVDMNYSCTRLTINAGSTFSCSGGYTLTITEAIIDENGNVRIEVSSSLVIGSGIEVPVSAQKSGTFTDARDGHEYDSITIGTQTWMAENLAYNAVGSWAYDNNESNVTTYGRLYNWATAMAGASSSATIPSGVQGFCPSGWHLPSDDEWTILTDFLGGVSEAGGKLKEAGITHWQDPNVGATNETGFTALPGGYYDMGGYFYGVTLYNHCWSSTEASTTHAWGRYFFHSFSNINQAYFSGGYGFSVRCVKN